MAGNTENTTQTVAGMNTEIQPTSHVNDIYLIINSDPDTINVTAELMQGSLDSVVSVMVQDVRCSVTRVLQLLPFCKRLSAVGITYTETGHNLESFVNVLPQLRHLDTLMYNCGSGFPESSYATVPPSLQLPSVKYIALYNVNLRDDSLLWTGDMTRLETVKLWHVYMSAKGWGDFLAGLLAISHAVHVTLQETNIDNDTVSSILTSPRITMPCDNRTIVEAGVYTLVVFSMSVSCKEG